MATKVLNLDEVEVTIPKQFIFKGKTHNMKPLSVGDFVKTTKRLEELDGNEASQREAVELMIDLVMISFPTLERGDVEALDVQKLQVLTAYIQTDVEDETDAGNAQ